MDGFNWSKFLSRKFCIALLGILITVFGYAQGALEQGQAIYTTLIMCIYLLVQGLVDWQKEKNNHA